MSAIYHDVFTYINDACNTYISASVANVAAALAPTAYTLMGVYIMLWGFLHLRGMIQEPVMDAAIRILKLALIISIAIKLASYNALITDTFFKAPEQLAQALTHATDNLSAIHALDNIIDHGFQIGKTFWDKGGFVKGDVGMYLIALFVFGLCIAVTAYACYLIVLSKIALAILISLGPVFILSLLFQPTANYFNTWIQQLSNYFLLIVLVIAANVFVVNLFANAADTISGLQNSAQIDQVFPFFVTGVITLLVLAQLPSIAAGLAGGMSLSSYGAGRLGLAVLSRATRKTAASAGKLGKKAFSTLHQSTQTRNNSMRSS